MTSNFQIPIILFIYRRPTTTQKVLEALEVVQPRTLFVIGDGPRMDQAGELEKVRATQRLIQQVSWSCEIIDNFSEVNLGLRKRIVSGLNWVFGQVEKAIILEDDCVPHPSFFPFCEMLLERYEDNEHIMVISGSNFQKKNQRYSFSYYFSRYPHCWGWATWRRAWKHYDDKMSLWPEVRDGDWLWNVLDGDRHAEKYWRATFQAVYEEKIDSWAYRWTFTCWIRGGLTVLPQVNLVENIGYGENATHGAYRRAYRPALAMEFPLKHPPCVYRDIRADRYTQLHHFGSGWQRRVKRRVIKLLSEYISHFRDTEQGKR